MNRFIPSTRRASENGNVMIYIFLAIVLLGALSFAVAQGNRGSIAALSRDRINLAATAVMDYGETFSKAVGQLRLRGLTPEEIKFSHTSLDPGYGVYDAAPTQEVFNPQGGAVILGTLPVDSLAVAGSVFQFSGSNEIEKVGTTCGAAGCSELVAFLPGVRQSVCVRINELLGIENTGDDPPSDNEIDDSQFFSGTFAYDQTVGDEATSAPLEGRNSGCFLDEAADLYVYYQVLIVR